VPEQAGGKPMWQQIGRWLNERWPLSPVLRWSLEEDMPGGTSFAYIFGSALFLTFTLQVLTGIWQLFYYVPTADHAYDSLSYLRLQVPFGWLIHNLHRWGANAMVVLIGLHMSRVFIWGAYKPPRQLTWLIGVGLLILTLGLAFTGPVLPWDQRGYWEAEVGTSMSGTVPLIGPFIESLLRGGGGLGQATLSRFFVLHVAILPGILLALISLHLVAFRQFGISGPWNEEKRKRTGTFWPDQILKDTIFFSFIFVILVRLSAFVPPSFPGPLDILAASYAPKPEWYFLFLYQSLKVFHANLEPVGTVGIPLLVTLFLLFLPFIDRNPERNPARRPIAMTGYLIFIVWVLVLSIAGYYSKPGVTTATASKSASAATNPPAQMSVNAQQGAQLFHSLVCIGCHRVHGQGGTLGPDLSSGVLKGKSRQWLITQIRDPKKHDAKTIMPAFASATDEQINEVVDYLLTLEPGKVSEKASPSPLSAKKTSIAKAPASTPPEAVRTGPHGFPGPAAAIIGNAELGAFPFKNICEACHGPEGKDKVPNPGSDDGTVPPLNPIDRQLFGENAQIFADQIDRIIQHGSIPEGPNPELHMLPFGDDHTLTQPQIANVEAYVMKLNGVNRAQLVHPGISPKLFFWLVVAAFGLVLLGLGIGRAGRKTAG
jgi:ubiquinol-cytochrome c reductase cytochrome b subunit